MKKQILRLFTAGCFALISATSFAGHLQDNLLFSAKLNGAQQTPAITTNAMGVGSFMLNNMRNELCINVAVNGLSGPITAAHIHEGAMGVGGGVLVDLSSGISGNQLMLTISGTDLNSALIAKMLNGMTYLNVHTAANPSGEIRGQIMLETDHGIVAMADGMQQVPMLMSTAYGLGIFTLSQDQNMINYQFIAQDLSGAITAAHLHMGAMGVSGAVVQDLTADIMGNMISGSFMATPALVTAIMNSEIYINVHTAMNAGGEIRGQLMMKEGLPFDAMLSGAQQVPAITTMANGVATFTLNSMLNEITYSVVTDGLSGPITMAHIHGGAIGVSGGVLVDLSAGINGNQITGTITGAAITDALINAMLKGETYVNVHTTANPGGEIRGQIYRLAREGYTTTLNGAQEVPAVSTQGYGAGIVSINRDQNNLHYMFVAGGLSSAITGAHFHNGVAGVNGGVTFDLSSSITAMMSDAQAFGYLTSMDATPFTSTESALFRNNAMYVNLHNAENMSGEIRGQINRGQVCYNTTLGINELNKELNVDVYPNPFNAELQINGSELTDAVSIQLIDVTGKVMMSEVVVAVNNSVTLSTASIQQGTYFVQIVSGNGLKITKKVVKF